MKKKISLKIWSKDLLGPRTLLYILMKKKKEFSKKYRDAMNREKNTKQELRTN